MGLFLVKFQAFIMNSCFGRLIKLILIQIFGMKRKNKTFGPTEIDASALVNIRLEASSDSFKLVYICLVTRLHSSTFVYTRPDLSRLV